jgi:hypothetical protein
MASTQNVTRWHLGIIGTFIKAWGRDFGPLTWTR